MPAYRDNEMYKGLRLIADDGVPGANLVLADWLQERGHDAEAQFWRNGWHRFDQQLATLQGEIAEITQACSGTSWAEMHPRPPYDMRRYEILTRLLSLFGELFATLRGDYS